MERKKKLLIHTLIYMSLCALFFSQVNFIVVTSESVPYSLCLQVYNLKPEKDDLCVLKFGETNFVKYVRGVAGDKVTNINGEIFVDYRKIGEVDKKSNLTAIDSCVIPEGYVFVAGTHPDSFDSRYKEFGLVKVSDIKGKAIGFLKHEEKTE
jgi:conjugal transfer pilin signal peptidase TrbI